MCVVCGVWCWLVRVWLFSTCTLVDTVDIRDYDRKTDGRDDEL